MDVVPTHTEVSEDSEYRELEVSSRLDIIEEDIKPGVGRQHHVREDENKYVEMSVDSGYRELYSVKGGTDTKWELGEAQMIGSSEHGTEVQYRF